MHSSLSVLIQLNLLAWTSFQPKTAMKGDSVNRSVFVHVHAQCHELYVYRCMYMLNGVNGCVQLLWCIGTYVCTVCTIRMSLTCMYKSVL